jgi:hypothetical protein
MPNPLDSIEGLVEEVVEEVIEDMFRNHLHRHHFPHHGRPRLTSFVLRKGKPMTVITYLNGPITTEIIQALDQYGIAYTGQDLTTTTVGSDTPTNVGAALGGFDLTNGQATLTLTQAGGEGDANVTISCGTVSLVVPVKSYVPVLTGFAMLPTVPAATNPPAASAPASTEVPLSTDFPDATDLPSATIAPSL